MDNWLVAPFAEFAFMRHALLGCVVLSLGAAPVGVFLLLRRLSLTGDAMAHAILPGAAVGYLIGGLSLGAMTIGGLAAGLLVALGAGWVSRHTALREDSSLAAFYLLSLASGVLIVSVRGGQVDLLHVLFGNVLALDSAALALLGGITAVSLLGLRLLYRPLLIDSLDPEFLRGVSRWGTLAGQGFLALVVLNLVAGFHALGTLLSVALMVLPAAAARLWVQRVAPLMVLAVLLALGCSVTGLLLSYHAEWPTSPVIVLCLGVAYLVSMALAPAGLLRHRRPARHHQRA